MTAETRRKPAKRTEGVIRGYTPADRQVVRDICCRTAFRNMGSDKIFEDRELHADYWTSYYLDYKPEDVRLVEQDGEVIGYFFGVTNHADFHRTMARKIVPKLLARLFWRAITRRYKKPETYRYIRFSLLQAWREEPKIPYETYPAAYHCNILRKGYGHRYYTQLVLEFLDRLDEIGVTGIHGHITEPSSTGVWLKFTQMFTDEQAQVGDEKPCTLFLRVLGDDRKMVNRAWGARVKDYRKWMQWMRETQRI